jgi:hypothetical protein
MGARLLVTIGTDGATNWVRTPDGQRFNLGSVPILSFVTRLVLGGSREARRALDGFLQGDEVMLRVDEDKMWELMTPRRSRWGATDSFIPRDQRTSRGTTMSTTDKLTTLEQHVQMLHQAAAASVSPKKMAEGVSILMRLADQLDEDEASREASEVPKDPKEEPVSDDTDTGTDKLAFDTYKANSKLATGILDKMEAVNDKVDQIVASGKDGFRAEDAKADIHEVTSKVAGIVSETDLATTPWVADDLMKLASRADYLHGLFFPKA